MKRLIILYLILTANVCFSQDTPLDSTKKASPDTTKIVLGNKTILIVGDAKTQIIEQDNNKNIEKNYKFYKDDLTYWSGFDIGINSYLNANNELSLGDDQEAYELKYPWSTEVSINFYEEKFQIAKNYMGLYTGMGATFNSYAFKNDYIFAFPGDTIISFMDSTRTIKKNKLNVFWLKIPLMLEFNTGRTPDNNFHFAAGVTGALRVASKYKIKYESDEKNFKDKIKDDLNLEPFQVAATVRFGFNKLNMFVNYSLTPLFDKDHGPELYPISAGITLFSFD